MVGGEYVVQKRIGPYVLPNTAPDIEKGLIPQLQFRKYRRGPFHKQSLNPLPHLMSTFFTLQLICEGLKFRLEHRNRLFFCESVSQSPFGSCPFGGAFNSPFSPSLWFWYKRINRRKYSGPMVTQCSSVS